MAYPVTTHLNDVWVPIFVLTEGLMPGATADGVAVFEDHEVIHGGIVQRLLVTYEHLEFLLGATKQVTYSSSNTSHSSTTVGVSLGRTSDTMAVIQNSNSGLLALSLIARMGNSSAGQRQCSKKSQQ